MYLESDNRALLDVLDVFLYEFSPSPTIRDRFRRGRVPLCPGKSRCTSQVDRQVPELFRMTLHVAWRQNSTMRVKTQGSQTESTLGLMPSQGSYSEHSLGYNWLPSLEFIPR